MKKIFLLLILCLGNIVACLAQTPPVPFQFQSNSNLKVRIAPNKNSPDWNFSPVPYPNWYFLGLYRITDYYQELKKQNDLIISNPDGNAFFHVSLGGGSTQFPYNTYNRDSTLIWHYGKFFFDGASDIGIDSGIVLSTGKVFYYGSWGISGGNLGPGPWPGISHKAQFNSSSAFNLGGNQINEPTAVQIPRLQQFPELVTINNEHPIADANIFEFDVTPHGNFISLDYVFASEEWPHNSCDSGADVMAIMLSGPGIVGEKNIAVLPGTQTPVNTKTVYPAGTSCQGPEPSPWYVDNTTGQNVIYNGFTKVLRAASIVQPCQPYHVRVMVADGVRHPYDSFGLAYPGSYISGSNPLQIDSAFAEAHADFSNGTMAYDAGVFLKMHSLRSTDTVRLTAIGGLSQTAEHPYAMRGCFNGKLRLSVSDSLPIARIYNLLYSGSALAGVDYQALPANVTLPAFAKTIEIPVNILSNGQGNKQLMVRVQSPYGTCLQGYQQFLDTAVLDIVSQYPGAINPSTTTICNGCSVTLEAQVEPGINYSYNWSPALGLSSTTVANPVAAPNVSTTYTLSITGTNGFANCAVGNATAQVNVGNVGVKTIDAAALGINIYPNPAKEQIKVTLEQGVFINSYQLADVLGRTMAHKIVNTGNDFFIETAQLPAGNYLLQLDSNKGVAVQKVDKL